IHARINRTNRRTRKSDKSRASLQDKSSRRPIGSKISNNTSNIGKAERSRISNGSKRVSSKTTPRTSGNKGGNSKINIAGSISSGTMPQDRISSRLEGARTSNGKSVSSRTTLQGNNKSKHSGNRINNSNSVSKTTLRDSSNKLGATRTSRVDSRNIGLHKSAAPLKSAAARCLGRRSCS